MNRNISVNVANLTHNAFSASVTPLDRGQATLKATSKSAMSSHLGMLLWALIVGSSFPAVGMMSEGLPPLLLTAIRFAVAALAILPLVWGKSDRWPSLPGLALYAFMGLSLAGFFGTMFWAAHRTSALSMATLYVSVPLLAYFLGRAFGVERRASQLLGILVLGAIDRKSVV
jgi:drug/metabolite transporter (DMT)-like permease